LPFLTEERVRNGLANARAKGKRIGRVKTRNSVLIRSLLDAGLSLREVSRIAKCSHGSVSLEKAVYKKEKAEAKAKRDEMIAQGLIPPDEPPVPPVLAADGAPGATAPEGTASPYSFTFTVGGVTGAAPAAT